LRGQTAPRNVPDAFDRADRGAAEFLYDDHCEKELSLIRKGEVNTGAETRDFLAWWAREPRA
jgi:hypothetical protein